MKNILFTGGSGLLGTEMKQLFPRELFPTSDEFNVSDSIEMFLYYRNKENEGYKIDTVVHMAALTSPPRVDLEPKEALNINIIGTANIVKLSFAHKCRLIYISTDYVFNGNSGEYLEEEPVCPVNLYAWSKLGGECAVRMYDNSVIIRTSFGPNEFPYEKAPIDQWTSREKVSDIALKIQKIIMSDFTGVIHVGYPGKRTVYDYAKTISPHKEIKKMFIQEMKANTPRDTSLDTGKFQSMFTEKKPCH